jgi:hypothetical protein
VVPTSLQPPPAVEVTPDAAHVTLPAGWGDRAAVAALRPDLVRALAPPLPPAEQWPEHYGDAYAERVAVASEGGCADPEAVALADLRVMHWRELCAADALAA